ncbi:hypothetical protein HYQ46_007148 [Verticillium longisporum]|nr:hypothetical protein HYQ46_007148 [Verticillium longisporum]
MDFGIRELDIIAVVETRVVLASIGKEVDDGVRGATLAAVDRAGQVGAVGRGHAATVAGDAERGAITGKHADGGFAVLERLLGRVGEHDAVFVLQGFHGRFDLLVAEDRLEIVEGGVLAATFDPGAGFHGRFDLPVAEDRLESVEGGVFAATFDPGAVGDVFAVIEAVALADAGLILWTAILATLGVELPMDEILTDATGARKQDS